VRCPLRGHCGIAALDLNYGGGAGFAREYRERLKLNWGIVDADDCVNGAKFLAEQGLVDLRRLVISGGSATDEEQVVPGDALCGSCTSPILSRWIGSSSGRVGSTTVLLGFLGGWGEAGQRDHGKVPREDDGLDSRRAHPNIDGTKPERRLT
jgi:Prolyl oligopeptidase family